jgi:hypothetical protein
MDKVSFREIMFLLKMSRDLQTLLIIIIVQFNSLFINVLKSTANANYRLSTNTSNNNNNNNNNINNNRHVITEL